MGYAGLSVAVAFFGSSGGGIRATVTTMTRVIAHRGASATHRANTLPAFRAAVEQGADGVELDVRLSADEVLVVHHDAQLPDGSVISSVESGSLPDHVPTLVEVLDVLRGLWVNVEIKNSPEDPDYDDQHRISVAVAGLLAAQRGDDQTAADQMIVSSFNVDSLLRLRAVDSTLPLGLLVFGQADPASLVARAEAHGFQGIHPRDVLVDELFVARARQAGLQVNVWTVNDPDRIRQLSDFGVDGIITDDPVAARQALGR